MYKGEQSQYCLLVRHLEEKFPKFFAFISEQLLEKSLIFGNFSFERILMALVFDDIAVQEEYKGYASAVSQWLGEYYSKQFELVKFEILLEDNVNQVLLLQDSAKNDNAVPINFTTAEEEIVMDDDYSNDITFIKQNVNLDLVYKKYQMQLLNLEIGCSILLRKRILMLAIMYTLIFRPQFDAFVFQFISLTDCKV